MHHARLLGFLTSGSSLALAFLSAEFVVRLAVGMPQPAQAHSLDPAFLVPGYGHPGREIHADWAACIGRALEPRLPQRPVEVARSSR